MARFEDITGLKYGRILIVSRAENGGSKMKPVTRWNCRCDCGTEKVIDGHSLRRGKTKSCGCLNDENRRNNPHWTHKGSQTRLYHIWAHMKGRCLNKRNGKYRIYGERGITICEEWADNFPAFRTWAMGNGYSENLTIDRINNNGNYEPSNCRWATWKEQANNTRYNRFVNFMGENRSLKYWEGKTGIKSGNIYQRLFTYKWPVDRALTVPERKY